MTTEPTLIGTVQDVDGATITVGLIHETVTGLSFIQGAGYRIGQVGGFVRVPLGYVSLYGIVSQVGAGAAPLRDGELLPHGNRWLRVQLVGEGHRNAGFQRGLSQHPTIDDPVHIVTEDDLRIIYGSGDPQDFVSIGHLASAESIPARIDINKLVTRHAAVVGATGAGKSTAVASLVAALSDTVRYPSARIVILDVHGEYARALSDRSTVFRTGETGSNARSLNIPYWALNFDELIPLAFGKLDEAQSATIADMIVAYKRDALATAPRSGISESTITVDSPVPFSLHRLWFELHKREHMTLIPNPGSAAEDLGPAYVLDGSGKPRQPGDAMSAIPPLYRTPKTSGPANERVQLGRDPLGIRRQLAALAAKLRDPRFAFLFRPGDWSPTENGAIARDLDQLLRDWIGGPSPVTILDLSGIPFSVLDELVGALLRILYDAVFWARNLPEGGRERPLFIVLEEAHAYLAKGSKDSAESAGPAAMAVKRIAKEGRKYGIGLMLVSQRPYEIDPTILSQCGTIFAMRLANDADRRQVAGASSDNLKSLFEMLPVLRTGEVIIAGEAVGLPIRALVDLPGKDRRPDSSDPRVAVRGDFDRDGFDGPGGWNQQRDQPDYEVVVRQWRKQSPHYEHEPTTPDNS